MTETLAMSRSILSPSLSLCVFVLGEVELIKEMSRSEITAERQMPRTEIAAERQMSGQIKKQFLRPKSKTEHLRLKLFGPNLKPAATYRSPIWCLFEFKIFGL